MVSLWKTKRLSRRFILRVLAILLPGQGLLWFWFFSIHRDLIGKAPGTILATLSLQAAVLAVFLFLIHRFFSSSITARIEELSSGIERVTAGDLTERVEGTGDDEIGSMARGLGFLTDRLSSTVKKLRLISGNVAAAISQLHLIFKDVAEGMWRQQSSSEEVLNAVRKVSGSQSRIIEHTERLLSLSGDNLSALLQLKSTSEEIAAGTERLKVDFDSSCSAVSGLMHSAREVASRAAEASSALQDASSSVEEVNASVKEVERNAAESARLSQETTEVISEKGMISVVDAVNVMERIEAAVRSLTEVIRRLDQRSQDIGKITSVIREITEQTGLLSLNAQILAVQAGEYGKGFSVVADEMSALSEKTAASAREIAGIVSTIKKEIEGAVERTEETVRMVEEGNGIVLKAGEALREILVASRRSSETAAGIERAVTEQRSGLGLILDSIERIKQMAFDVNTAAEGQERSTAYLLEKMDSMKDSLELTRKATDEQVENARFITDNIELANEMTAEITRASSEQQALNGEVVAALEEIIKTSKDSAEGLKEVSLLISSLRDEVESLKQGMGIFNTGDRRG